jgi:DNA-binding transcriptional LysR family regulator
MQIGARLPTFSALAIVLKTFRSDLRSLHRTVFDVAAVAFTVVALALGGADLAATQGAERKRDYDHMVDVVASQTMVLVSPAAPTVGAASQSALVSANRVPLFFGYLEFDWDPDVAGGMPGFGPLNESAAKKVPTAVSAEPFRNESGRKGVQSLSARSRKAPSERICCNRVNQLLTTEKARPGN